MNLFIRSMLAAIALIGLTADPALAHFGMIIPSSPMVMKDDAKSIKIEARFWHPMEGNGMNLAKPKAFGVATQGQTVDLLGSLKEKKVNQNAVWETDYKVTRPGVYCFFMEPQPYWEPAEDHYIVHYTKSYVAALGDDEGWDKPVGLKTEIVPLSRPFGLYAGNVFQGVVMLNGKPVPEARVEVEFYNQDGKVKAPNDYMVTQSIKADKNGVFTYAAPRAGWWGFSAVSTDDQKIAYQGNPKNVEIAAVIWVKFFDMK
ncbi:MAG: DUF4198 domain-containing protein [Deltaproteobacteria bacterium]|nr:DUF4198 domain-containing protein [Deltaproteobacteria bacterium]